MSILFQEALSNYNINLSEKQVSQFELYYTFLVKKNEVMNLTTITERDDVYKKHFLDSLSLVKTFTPSNQTILDVGSGAGFPSLPLKICFPSLQVTIVDSLQKRIGFLQELVSLLDLSNVTLIHGRAEELRPINQFDIVTARAVAKLNILVELCLPFVKVGGRFIAMKSTHIEEELKEAKRAIDLLGGSYQKPYSYELSRDLVHTLVIIQKIKPTSDHYPRPFSQIKGKPL